MNSKIFISNRVRGRRIIHTASSFARRNLIYLQEIGNSEYLQPYESMRGRLSSFLFCIVKSGSGKLVYHDIVYNLEKDDCILINCSYNYTISSKDDLWKLDWIHFDGNTMSTIYDKYIERCGGPCFKATDISAIENVYSTIFDMATTYSYVQDMELMSQLSLLLTTLMKQCWKKSSKTQIEVAKKRWGDVKSYIDNNYRKSMDIEELASKFSINKYYLVRSFKEVYGYTINQYITNLRITAAKELLRFKDYNMTEISYMVGYNDSAYFSRVFTKEVGIPPLKFRKQWNGKVG